MTTEPRCVEGDCPTIGVEAAALERFADVSTDDDDLLIYDREEVDAWIQSDLYFARESCA